MAFYETVMVKGYETLVDSDIKVDVNTGMIAAGRLQTLIESRAGRTSMADILSCIPIHAMVWPNGVRHKMMLKRSNGRRR